MQPSLRLKVNFMTSQRLFSIQRVVCSTPHALSPDVLSPHALSPCNLSPDRLSEKVLSSEKLCSMSSLLDE